MMIAVERWLLEHNDVKLVDVYEDLDVYEIEKETGLKHPDSIHELVNP